MVVCLIGHGHMHVHAENQQGARQLLQLFNNILITLSGRNYLIDPAGEGMRARSGHLQTGAFGSGHQFAARAMHLDAQFMHAVANIRAGLHNRLVHLVLHLFHDSGRSRGDQLHHVRTQLAGGRVDDLEFFFYADGKAVRHGVAIRLA